MRVFMYVYVCVLIPMRVPVCIYMWALCVRFVLSAVCYAGVRVGEWFDGWMGD